jgi:hypothetical protein
LVGLNHFYHPCVIQTFSWKVTSTSWIWVTWYMILQLCAGILLKTTSQMILVDMGATVWSFMQMKNNHLYSLPNASISQAWFPFWSYLCLWSFTYSTTTCLSTDSERKSTSKLPIIGSMLASSPTQKANWIHCNYFLTITIKLTLFLSSWILTIQPLKCP